MMDEEYIRAEFEKAEAAGDFKRSQAILHYAASLQEQAQQPQAPAPSETAQLGGETRQRARGLLQGATAGFGDELTAATGAVANLLVGDTNEHLTPWDRLKETYTGIRDQERGKQAQFAEESPWWNAGLQGAGAVAAAPLALAGAATVAPRAVAGAEALSPLARATLAGTSGGALAGAGVSEADSLGGLAGDTAIGAGLGAVAGPVAHYGTEGLRYAAQTAGRIGAKAFSGPQAQARSVVNDALDRGDSTVRQVNRDIAAAGPEGKPYDSPALFQPTRAFADKAPIEAEHLARQKAQAAAISKVINEEAEKVGVRPRSLKRSTEALRKVQQRVAKEDYDRAYAAPMPEGQYPELVNLLEHPSIGPAMRKAYKEGAEISPDLRVNTREMVNYNGSMDPEDWTWKRLPSWREYDIIQRGLRRQAEKARASGDKSLARHLNQEIRKPLLDRLDAANPDFLTARRNFAGSAAVQDAGELGTKAFDVKTTAEDLSDALEMMTPSERAHAQLGALKALGERINNTRDKQNLAVKLLGDPASRAKMSMLFGEEATEAVSSELERTSRNIATTGRLTGGSDTAGTLRAGEQGDDASGAVFDMATGGGTGAFLGLMRKLFTDGRMSAPVQKRVSKMLGDPAAFRSGMNGRGRNPVPPLGGFPATLGGLEGGSFTEALNESLRTGTPPEGRRQ